MTSNTELKPTAGPWKVVPVGTPLDHEDGFICEDPNSEYEIRPDGPQKLGDILADMQLMAAAPEMRKIIQVLCTYLSCSLNVTDQNLAKAMAQQLQEITTRKHPNPGAPK